MLKDPIKINQLTLRNRIVMPPMATRKAVNDLPTEELVGYYAARAEATGLIIVEHGYISAEGMAHANQLSMAEDAVIPAYQNLTAAVHEKGAAIFAQISHAGARASGSGLPAVSPSGIPVREGDLPHAAMTQSAIAQVRGCFVKAALRAKEAGFDGVEIHGAHGYLLSQFYSPLTNRRTDAYTGATLAGRTRLHLEVLRAVREAVGPAYPVAIRFGACDYMEGGSQIKDIRPACMLFEEAGADLIDISGGLGGYVRPDHKEPGWFAELSRPAKESTNIPVLLTGGITTAEDAERLLQEGAADLIGVGRAMLTDADWSVKALA